MEKLSERWAVNPQLDEVELVYRTSDSNANNPQLSSPEEVSDYLRSIWNQDHIELQEEFYVLLFNNAMRVLGWSKISSGGRTATIVDVSYIVQLAVLSNASSVIVAHNHPSSQNSPSTADINLTKRIQSALQILSITLKDHIILSRQGYYSFLDHNRMPNSYSEYE